MSFFKVAQGVMPFVNDARTAKSSFQLRKVMTLIQQTASTSVAKGRSDSPEAWQAVGEHIDHILREINAILPLAMEPDNVMKSEWCHFSGIPIS
jgi:dynactin 1